jgi:hypothetical protein
MRITVVLILFCFISCHPVKKMNWPESRSHVSGTEFYRSTVAMKWKERDSAAVKQILAGNIPGFLERFVPVHVSIVDSTSGRTIKATYYVSPDYLSIGNDNDWARIPLTPMAAQQVADTLGCFLPTRKMADDIYKAATVKLEPVPMYAFRDSTITMWHHHLIVEGQRKGRKGLIAGIKKDVVISGKITRDNRPGREAIYGWHKPDGKAIQPLYTGHINWWVDYSHGIRLVYQQVKVNNKWMNYQDVLKDPVLQKLLCDEEFCDFYKYPY